MRDLRTVLATLVLAISSACGSEYFVGTRGNDGASGRLESEAFATVAKGLLALKPGDTLTLLPGEYFGASDVRISGAQGKPLTVHGKGQLYIRGVVGQ